MIAVTEHGRLPEGTVTLLFTDIEGSTRLLHEIGDRYGDVLAEHDRLLRAIWSAHDGVVVHSEGDAFLVAFADADEAAQAAAAAQLALDSHRWVHGGRLRVRMGMHTGAVRVIGNDYWGVDVHYAARLCAAASGGQVLLSAATRELVHGVVVDDLGEHGLKDFTVPRSLFHLRVGGAGADRFPPPRTLARVRTNLPSSQNVLIGRERELAEMREALKGEVRLLTVTGVGGSGKTRLALACGADLLSSFCDGVFLVRLAPVERPDDVGLAIASALGAPIEHGRDPEAALMSYLAAREMLLIVDNMEHLLAAAPLLSGLLEAAPSVRMLVSSQAPLRLTSEMVLPLGPLDVPSSGAQDIAALEQAPAAELFLQRARAADPSFALTPGDARAVAELCRRLEGLPLALELAAARVRIGGPRRLLTALERGIDALGSGARDLPARQHGLRAALDYTASLLDEEPRQLLAALGVFAGAWTIEQVENLFGDQLDVWEATASLLDFALIRTSGDGRLSMAEPVRLYAQELLEREGRDHDARRRHALMFAAEAESIDDELLLDTRTMTSRVVELANEFTSALRWSRTSDASIHRRLVGALGTAYYLANRLPTIASDVVELVAEAGDDKVSARLHQAHAVVLALAGETEASAAAAGEAVRCLRELGDERGEAIGLAVQARLLNQEGTRDARAGKLAAAGLRLSVASHDPGLQVLLRCEFAVNQFYLGHLDRADALLSEIVPEIQRSDSFSAMTALGTWADCALARGQFEAALFRLGEALRASLGMPMNECIGCLAIAAALAGLGRDAEAIDVVSAVEAVSAREGLGWVMNHVSPPEQQRLDQARARLGQPGVAEASKRGRDRGRDELLEFALALPSDYAPKQDPALP
ncbi:MAG TPA: adenylate/guanylate cyclase domain-containing protein [Solirubrobacteraceae bacterium]|nr:adenylate/guanylate cyclase domain-containing protein [Solirubrobacteraceae bacterium]